MKWKFSNKDVRRMSQTLTGRPAPDFTLPASGGKQVSLGDYKGKKVVLYFYPKDMTPGCTKESCDFRDDYAQFAKLGAEVIGISPDGPDSHDRFIAAYNLPFPLLADVDHRVCELYGVWKQLERNGQTFMGVERSTFLIDERGIVAREWRKVNVEGHVGEVLEAVKAIG
jgi:peroxiredoxin Q/BCP